jgi:hypothetical protein
MHGRGVELRIENRDSGGFPWALGHGAKPTRTEHHRAQEPQASSERPAQDDERNGACIDLREIGAEHGRNAAKCIFAALEAGVPDWAICEFHQKTIMPGKACELREIGASDEEIAVYIEASWQMTTSLVSAVGMLAETGTA